ncbi:MAG: hypothetical protein LBC70_08150 [Chitinispirillales bacterium]|nr:hypothetical protein [Chitinispirillales bacterium]
MSIKKVLFCSIVVSAVAAGVISCGGGKATNITTLTGNEEITSPRTELRDLANERFADHYVGIGQGISDKEGIASRIAMANARAEIAANMQARISEQLKNASLNTINDEAIETTMRRLNEDVEQSVMNSRTQKERILYNRETGKYTAYVLQSVSQADANRALRNRISGNQAIYDATVSKALMDIIDAELDK